MAAPCSRIAIIVSRSSSTTLSTLISYYPHDFNHRSFSSSSRRQRRRRHSNDNKRATDSSISSSVQQQQQVVANKNDNNNDNNNETEVIHKKPWYLYITIWPDPHGYDPVWEAQQGIPWPKSYQQFKVTFRKAMVVYLSSHEGWLLPEKKKKESDDNDDGKDNDEMKKSVSELINQSKEDVSANVSRNVEFLQTEGNVLKKRFQEETGVVTMQDLRAWAGRQMQLATECLKTFMEGYRQGRDEEVERMLNTNEYNMFPSDEEESKGKRRKRKPKRRIRTAD